MKLFSGMKPRRSKSRRRREEENYQQLGIGGVLLIFGSAAVATTLGVMLVNAEFGARDYEMEARRLQEISRERRDDAKKLQSRIGGLKRGELLREAALGSLGMVEPPAEVIGELAIDPSVIAEFEKAEKDARQRIVAERERLENFKKEEL